MTRKIQAPSTVGPFFHENWHEALAGKVSDSCIEFPLYTDAHIIGNDLNFGPYTLFNAVAFDNQLQQPSIVLRVDFHVSGYVQSEERETDSGRYHGGLIQDEIAALVSLCLGIRLKSGSPTRQFSSEGDPRGRPISWPSSPQPMIQPIFLKTSSG